MNTITRPLQFISVTLQLLYGCARHETQQRHRSGSGGVEEVRSHLGGLSREDPRRASCEEAGNFIFLAFVTSEVEEPQVIFY
jgi:hypothetical protein